VFLSAFVTARWIFVKFNTSAGFVGIFRENPNVVTTTYKYQALYMKTGNVKSPQRIVTKKYKR
jgi:hypothetical protein